ncbi:DUF1800 domain-containing protein [Telmatospirillum sp.]|uniref:DUF1800 domain-containing protein n=1 Tax=Telmatospirillum sp. TaxID=2079197 RepID=UPI00284C6FD8|nr:DUF1800 domain-containing protein [Telmatospirillum sp.]MDR3440701.1 DUF1800 domain-containing protein [Telmatospirillum sp.]
MSIPVDRLLLNRLAFGGNPADLTEVGQLGADRWIDSQLAPAPGDDPGMVERLAAVRLHIKYDAGEGYAAADEMRPLALLDRDVADLWPLTDGKHPMAGQERQRPRQEVAAATLLRAIHSRWQLREVLVDFWHNHFNVNAAGDQAIAAALPAYDRMIRIHAFGNFREFLEAVATSSAMLTYLNNRSSRAGNANENFGRELLELHSLGRDAYLNDLYNRWRDVPGALKGRAAGYIDQDVYEAARAFTGWTIEDGAGLGGGQSLPATGRFAYVEAWHDNYQKRVLGVDFDPFQSPMADGRKVLDLVAFHPATARFVCTKLCRRLVADVPPDSLVKAATAVWIENQKQPDQIRRVVGAIAHAPETRQGFGAKVKRPLELVASYARGAGIDATVTEGLLNELDGSGQKLFGWAAPTGYPDSMDYWLSSHVLRKRWTLVLGLTENWWGTGVFLPTQRLGGAMTAEQAVSLWHEDLTGAVADDGTVGAILSGLQLAAGALLAAGRAADPQHRRILAYCAMTPAFNLR